jgi:hypothetical protein
MLKVAPCPLMDPKKSAMVHRALKPPKAHTAHTPMREYQTRLYVTSASIARAQTGASSNGKESAFEQSERSEDLAQVGPLAHHGSDDPRPDRHLPALSRSGSGL